MEFDILSFFSGIISGAFVSVIGYYLKQIFDENYGNKLGINLLGIIDISNESVSLVGNNRFIADIRDSLILKIEINNKNKYEALYHYDGYMIAFEPLTDMDFYNRPYYGSSIIEDIQSDYFFDKGSGSLTDGFEQEFFADVLNSSNANSFDITRIVEGKGRKNHETIIPAEKVYIDSIALKFPKPGKYKLLIQLNSRRLGKTYIDKIAIELYVFDYDSYKSSLV